MEGPTIIKQADAGIQTESIDYLDAFHPLHLGGNDISKLVSASNMHSIKEVEEIDIVAQNACQASIDLFNEVIKNAKARGKGIFRDVSVKIYSEFGVFAENEGTYNSFICTQALAREVWDTIKSKLLLPPDFSRNDVDLLFANNKSLSAFITDFDSRTYELNHHQDYINKENERNFQSMMKEGLMYRSGISAIIAAADRWHEMVHEADGLPLGESDWLFPTQTDRDIQKKYLDDLARPYGLRVDYAKHPTGNEWHPFERDTSRVNYYLGDSEVPMTFEELEEWWVTEGYKIDPTLFIKTTKFEGSEMVI